MADALRYIQELASLAQAHFLFDTEDHGLSPRSREHDALHGGSRRALSASVVGAHTIEITLDFTSHGLACMDGTRELDLDPGGNNSRMPRLFTVWGNAGDKSKSNQKHRMRKSFRHVAP